MQSTIPEYDWGQNTEDSSSHDLDKINIPSPPAGLVYGRKKGQHINGKGLVNAASKHPLIFLDSIRQWFDALKWRVRDHVEPNSPKTSATFLECVIDYEPTSGYSLDGARGGCLSCGQKAKRLAYNTRCRTKVNGIKWNGLAMTPTKAIRPTTDATSLTPLGGPLIAGVTSALPRLLP